MLKTNKDKLVEMAVQGEISHPRMYHMYDISHKGEVKELPTGCGGICYNVKVGDDAYGWLADHLEPGVTVVYSQRDMKREEILGLHIPVCVGNRAIVIGGDAKGIEGIVTGLHTGVLIDFPQDSLEKLTIGDKVLIRAYGGGLKLLDFPEIKCMNITPELLEKICYVEEDVLNVRVRRSVPSNLMGSGIGAISSSYVDYDIMTSDEKLLKKYKLKDLKLGDIVVIEDHFCGYGPAYRKGAVTVGVVVHGDSVYSGHGPGVLPFLTSEKKKKIKITFDDKASIGYYLNCGRFREK
jgi:hypothetical protein